MTFQKLFNVLFVPDDVQKFQKLFVVSSVPDDV